MKSTKAMALLALTLAASVNLWAQQLTVAVSVFEARGGMAASDGEAVAELVMAELVADKTLKVVDRNNFDKIMAEMKFQMSDLADDKKVAELGKALGANSIIRGSVMALGGQTVITSTILDITTAQIISSSRLNVKSMDEIFDRITPFVKELITHLPKAAPTSTGIAIEVSTTFGGVLYFQGQEVATLWENDTHTIPIEKPGTYTVRLLLTNGHSETRSVTVTSRGTVKVAISEFAYRIAVSTKFSGVLYLQGREIARLKENDTHTIPVEGPGTYTVRLLLANGHSETRSVTVSSPGTATVAISEIMYRIAVSTKFGGVLYLQGREITRLKENETHTIPVEGPGTYTVKLGLANGYSETRSIAIYSPGTATVAISELIPTVGMTGPGGGIVFYDKGNNNGGWRYLEAAPPSTEFQTNWNDALNRCNNMVFGGYDNWVLPDKEQLNLMYENLKQKWLGGFSDKWYWSSSQGSNGNAWWQNFGDGRQYGDGKSSTLSVRAVRAF